MNPPARDGDDERKPRPSSQSIDATLEILADGLRRDVIEYCVDQADTRTRIEDLADYLVRKQERKPADRALIRTKLHHKHLPMLDEYGLIEFDPRGGHLRYRPDELVEEWLARIRAGEPE